MSEYRGEKDVLACRKKKLEDEQLRQQLYQVWGEVFTNKLENVISTYGKVQLGFFVVPDQAWTLLGRYISNNTHLHTLIMLNGAEFTDNKISCFFTGLVGSVSLKKLDLNKCTFGAEGLRSMVQFFQKSPELNELNIGSNDNLNSECFEVVLRSLHCRGGIQKLSFSSANIADISALETYNIRFLQDLDLSCNNIGIEGIKILSNLLQKEDSSLTTLDISKTGAGDEEAEILATALKRNTKLTSLLFLCNIITKKGAISLSKALLDMSSIDSTYNSNHTLTKFWLSSLTHSLGLEMHSLIDDVCDENKNSSNPGMSKVIRYQLKSESRKEQCHLQGIDCSSTPFADIEVKLLPNIFALIGNNLGQSEFYTTFILMVPELLSYIDRRAMLTGCLVSNLAQLSALSTQYLHRVTEYERHSSQMLAMYERLLAQQSAEYDRLVVTQRVNRFSRQVAATHEAQLLSYMFECQRNVTSLKANYERNITSLKAQHIFQTSRLTAENVEVSRRLKLINSEKDTGKLPKVKTRR